jgi:Uma2 family endonuclease
MTRLSGAFEKRAFTMATEVSSVETVGKPGIPADALYEVIDGQIVELPPMGTRQVIMANGLLVKLATFVDAQKLGRAVMEMLFDFTEQVGRKRRPDVAFVSNERWPRAKPIPESDGWQVVPNLAVEVVSPTNAWYEVLEKIHEYFHVGVERVWVVTASQRQVHVFDAPTSCNILALNDELTDDRLLPGFRLPLAQLFEVEDRATEQAS